MKSVKPAYISKGALVIYWLMFTFWVLGVYPFLLQTVSTFDLFEVVDGRLAILFEGGYIVLGLLLLRSRADMAIIGSFMVMNFIGTVIVNELPLIEWFNGIRFYCTLLFMLPVMRYAMATRARREFFVELMDRSLYIFLWLQGPCMIYQLVVYGGWDYGGGTLGFYQSGICSEMIYTISFYLMLRRWDYSRGYLSNLGRNWLLIVLLYPSLLNETKASLIFMVLYFIFLVPVNKKMIRTLALAIPSICIAIFVFYYFYQALYGNRAEQSDILTIEYFDFYVVGDESSMDLMELAYENSETDDDVDFQRGLKWAALPWLMDDKGSTSWFWGNGTGTDKGHSEEDPSKFAQSYRWLLQGTLMTLEMIVIECGIWGAVWFIAAMVVLFRGWYRHVRHQKQLTLYLVGLLMAVVFYNTSMNIFTFCLLFYYLAYLCSRWYIVEDFPNISSRGSVWTLGGIFTNVNLSDNAESNTLAQKSTSDFALSQLK